MKQCLEKYRHMKPCIHTFALSVELVGSHSQSPPGKSMMEASMRRTALNAGSYIDQYVFKVVTEC